MKKILSQLVVLSCFLLCFSACKDDSFIIEGDIEDMGTQNLRIIYVDNGTIAGMWMPAVDGKFSYHGNSNEFTIVEILNKNMEPVCAVAAKNGDKISITGSFKTPYNLTISGTEINDRWTKFVNDNSEYLTKGDRKGVEINIEKYIRKNPKDEVSAMLLTLMYANIDNITDAEKLQKTIDPAFFPQYLLDRFNSIKEETLDSKLPKKITAFNLYSSKDSLENFNPAKKKATLLYFWLPENSNHSDIIKEIKRIQNSSKGLQVADITLENDSTIWKRELRKDSISNWKHFWGLGGRMNGAIKEMGVKNAPYFLVTDSAGVPIYRGVSLDAAAAAVDKKFK